MNVFMPETCCECCVDDKPVCPHFNSSTLLIKSSGLQKMTLFYLFQVNLTLEREVAGVWVKVPCVDDLGSCYYPDACVRLAQLFKTVPELCPEPKRSSSVPCGCPFRAVSVSSFTEHPQLFYIHVFKVNIYLFYCFVFFRKGP